MKTMSELLPNLAVASFMMVCGGAAWAQDGAPIPLLPAPSATVIAAPAAAAGIASGGLSSGNVRTTTDTLEYCKELLGRIGKLMGDHHNTTVTEARYLSQEGERLCQHGHAKGGILRLRQAYVLLSPAKPGN